MYPIDAAFFEGVFGTKDYFEKLARFEESRNPSSEDMEAENIRKIGLRYLAKDYLKKYALSI